jgi:hypothetical protein
MMYSVVWLGSALDRLADIYVLLDLTSQDRLAAAVDALNARLRTDPLSEGESRSGRYRITFVDRIAVRFWVDDSAGRVGVTAVEHFRR